MKKTLFLLFYTSLALQAQVPQKMSYQAVLRDVSNELLSLHSVGMRISITRRDISGIPVYSETHYTNTNINGVVTVQVGQGGVITGNFSKIDWSLGPYFIKTETDPNGGSDYQIIGSSELLSVPFALYALNSSSVDQDFVKTTELKGSVPYEINVNGGISVSKNVTVAGNLEALGATSTLGTNEKPFKGLFISSGSLSIASDTLGKNIPAAILSNVGGNLQISAGGVKLMGDQVSFIAPNIVGKLAGNASSATKLDTPRTINGMAFDGTQNIEIPIINSQYVKLSQLAGIEAYDIDLKGNISASKNVTVAGNIEALGSTSTLGTIEKPFKGLFISSGSLSIASDTLGQNVPPAVLSNVAGNLQISAGGVKLLGTNASFIAPNIVGELTGNASSATKFEVTHTINNLSFNGTQDIVIPIPDTMSLSRRINTKLAVSDTTTFAAKFYRITNPSGYITSAAITGKLNTSDTSALLNRRFARDTLSLSRRINTKLAVSDTTTFAAKFYRITNPSGYITSAAITGKLNTSDTSALLNRRFARDTLSLSRRINLKLGRIGNQTISGDLTVNNLFSGKITANDIDITRGYTVNTPSVSFPNGSMQTSASHILLSQYYDGRTPEEPTALDLSISVHKLADSYFLLKEGTEGQIIYFVPNGGGASAEDIHIIVERARKWDRGRIIELEKVDWQPFFPLNELPTIVMAIFSDGAWNTTSGTLR